MKYLQLSQVRTPHSNGIVEKKNQMLMERARCMIQVSKAPHFLWVEAVNIANYLVNWSPTRANLGTTPFERLTSKTPNLNHLKVFGNLAYIHVDKEEKNLDAKAIKTTFIGCDSKRKDFRCYSPLLRKIIVSKDVLFDESQFGFLAKPNVSRLDIVFPPNPIFFPKTNNSDEVHDGEPTEPSNDKSTSRTQSASSP